MFRIYIPDYMLQQIELDELDATEHTPWYKILHASPIGTYKRKETQENYNSEGFIDNYGSNEIMNGTNLDVDKSDFIVSIENDISRIIENPCGYYILDITPDYAKEIRNEYGILCFSISERIQIQHLKEIEIFKTSIKKRLMSWEDNFPLGKLIPCNVLIISDRNLFSRVYGENPPSIVYDNLKSLITSMRWKPLDICYNILVIFDENAIKPDDKDLFSFDNITKELDTIRNSIPNIAPDKVTIELLSVTAPKKEEKDKLDKRKYINRLEAHNRTHDRRILSNYFYGFTTFRLIAFNNKECLHRQIINFMTLFCKGLNGYSDSPYKEHDRMYDDLRFIYKTVIETPEYYHYSINGNIKFPTSLVNRLLTATEL